jgi:hypothetical protein
VASSTGGTASFLEAAGPWVLAGSQLSFWSAEEGKQSFHYQAGASLHQGLDHAREGGKGVSPSLVFWSIETLCGQSPLPVRTLTVSIVRFSFDCFCCGQARVALLAFSGSKKRLALLSLTLADCNHQGLWWVLAHAPLLNIDGPHCFMHRLRDLQKALLADLEQIEDNAHLYRVGRESAYQAVAIQLRNLLLKGRRGLLGRVISQLMLHQLKPSNIFPTEALESFHKDPSKVNIMDVRGRLRLSTSPPGAQVQLEFTDVLLELEKWLDQWVYVLT